MRKGMFRQATSEAEAKAGTQREDGEDYVLHSYPDYATYRAVQDAGNSAKLKAQFVKESHIAFLALYLAERCGPVSFGLCHGVRRGLEQAWFSAHLAGTPLVIGTDIAESASRFANTVQWDFHEPNPDWAGRADFVYSNSWDHAYDPRKAFRSWAQALRPGGVMLLDHSRGHAPASANALDPFGATEPALLRFLNEACGDLGAVVDVLDRSADPAYRARVIVFAREG